MFAISCIARMVQHRQWISESLISHSHSKKMKRNANFHDDSKHSIAFSKEMFSLYAVQGAKSVSLQEKDIGDFL